MVKQYFIIVLLALLTVNCKKDKGSSIKQTDTDTLPVVTNPDDTVHNPGDTTDINPVDTISSDTTISDVYRTNYFVYISLDSDKKIAVYKMDSLTGRLSLVEEENTVGNPGSLAQSRSEKYLYAAIRSTGQVSTFAINALNGKLRLVKTTDVYDNPVYISPDQSNKYLLSAYFNGNKIAVYPIIGDSIIDKNYVQILDAGINPHCILADATNKYVYTAVMTGGQVLQFSFNENTGMLFSLNPASIDFGADIGPRHIDFHPNGRWVYIVNEIANSIYSYTKNNDGTLTKFDEVGTLPVTFIEFSKCADIHITPDARYIYASNRGHNSIAAFSINSITGKLTVIDQYDTEADPRSFVLDPTGKYLYAGGESTGKLAAYKINSDGSLTKFETYTVGTKVTWISIFKQKTQEKQ